MAGNARWWHVSVFTTRWRALAALACCAIAAREAGASSQTNCAATDYAPELIPIQSEPATGRGTKRLLPRDSVPSLTNTDAVAEAREYWLRVRGAASGWVSAKHVACRMSPDTARAVIATISRQVVTALKASNMTALARYVHPVRGVRLSPYAMVDPEQDVVIRAGSLASAWTSTATRVWGRDDASAKPIRLRFCQYFRRFVYDRDFAAARTVGYNLPGDGTQKAWDVYPSAIVTAYHVPETSSRPAEALRLVFEQHRGRWYLVGIIHDGSVI